MRSCMTRRNSAEEMMRSAFLPAMSVRWPRMSLAINSKVMASVTPILSTHRVSMDLFGMTRSYTFMTYSELTSARKLMMKVATMTW